MSAQKAAADLRVAALTPFTTIDFPGRLSAVVFVQGCPWRCGYCHNVWMQPRAFDPSLEHSSWEELVKLLERRRGLLDGVVFSGGEPTVDPALPAALEAVRKMGFQTGLHTGGAYPAHVKAILGLVDWIGLDVKAAPVHPERFDAVTGAAGSCAHFLESFRLIKASGVAFECRTTAHPAWLPQEELEALAGWLKAEEVEHFALQIYRRPPGGLFAPYPAVDDDYPSKAARACLRAAVRHYVERRAD